MNAAAARSVATGCIQMADLPFFKILKNPVFTFIVKDATLAVGGSVGIISIPEADMGMG